MEDVCSLMGGKSLSQGKCFKNKFHPSEPQCTETEVHKSKPLGNITDNWTWCKKHLEILDKREKKSDNCVRENS